MKPKIVDSNNNEKIHNYLSGKIQNRLDVGKVRFGQQMPLDKYDINDALEESIDCCMYLAAIVMGTIEQNKTKVKKESISMPQRQYKYSKYYSPYSKPRSYRRKYRPYIPGYRLMYGMYRVLTSQRTLNLLIVSSIIAVIIFILM